MTITAANNSDILSPGSVKHISRTIDLYRIIAVTCRRRCQHGSGGHARGGHRNSYKHMSVAAAAAAAAFAVITPAPGSMTTGSLV
jgi:hypothetical protein